MVPTLNRGKKRSVHASHVADSLGSWTYRTMPCLEDAIYERLSRTFPNADISRGENKMQADVVVDGVGVKIVRGLHSGSNREFRILLDQYDELVFYSPSVHQEYPDLWARLKHLYGSERNPHSNVRFVDKKPPSSGIIDETPANEGLALLIPLVMFGIGGVLAAFLGVFAGSGTHMTTEELLFVGVFAAIALVVSMSVLFVRGTYRQYCNSLIVRLNQ